MLNKIKSLAQDTAIYGSFRIIGKMLSFLLTPIYTNYILDSSEFAFITYIFSLIAIINVVYSLGLEAAFFRFFNIDDETKGNSKQAFSNAYLSIAFISTSITILILFFSHSIAQDLSVLFTATESKSLSIDKIQDLLIIAAFIPFLDSLLWIPYDYLRMVRKAKKFALVQFSLILIAVSFTILFIIVFDMNAKGVIIAQLIATISGLFLLRKEVFANLIFTIDKALLKKMFIFGIPVMLGNLPAMVLQVFDKVLLPVMDVSNFAYNTYTVNYRLGIPMMLIVSMFEYAWKPFFLTHYKDKDAKKLFSRVFTYFTLLSAFVFISVSFFVSYIVRMPFLGGKLINPIYWEGLYIIPIILAGYYFFGVITNFSAGFHITKKTKYITIVMWGAAFTNIVLNIWLIPIFGYIGAAWATFIAYFVGAVLSYWYSKKTYPIKYEWKRIFLIIIMTIAIYYPIEFLTQNIGLTIAFIIKSISILLFVFLLKVFGFFTNGEIKEIKLLFKRK